MSFLYTAGDIQTTKPWERPHEFLIKRWYNDYSKYFKDEYKMYIGGGVSQGIETWDLDICLLGEIKDYSRLKDLLDTGIRLGFEHLMLVDIFWQDRIYSISKPFEPFVKIRSWENCKKIRDGIVEVDYTPDAEKIEGDLWKTTYLDPPHNFIYSQKMFNEGKYTEENKLIPIQEYLNA
tara:strand:+ start:407 stop:940 length:534 start_codon:yes stop_codon:yes gene_type:complete